MLEYGGWRLVECALRVALQHTNDYIEAKFFHIGLILEAARMARVTIEDCIDKIPNRFELVLLAAQRARSIASGAPLMVERDNDKNPVVSLREIAEQAVIPAELREDLITSMQRYSRSEGAEPGSVPLLAGAEQDEAVDDMNEADLLSAIGGESNERTAVTEPEDE